MQARAFILTFTDHRCDPHDRSEDALQHVWEASTGFNNAGQNSRFNDQHTALSHHVDSMAFKALDHGSAGTDRREFDYG
jgi:hypothetical protein